MSLTRIATYFGAVLLAAFVVIVLAYGAYGGGDGILVGMAIVLLIVAGSGLYGRRSRYGAIAAHKRPAQDAHNSAADIAADARRATAEAAKMGERYCPLDPADHAHHVATNGHASAARPAPPPAAPPQPT